MTDTAKTGTQQLLLSTSLENVVCSIDFGPLVGRNCFFDTSGLGDESDGYVTYRIRQELIAHGVRLAESRGRPT